MLPLISTHYISRPFHIFTVCFYNSTTVSHNSTAFPIIPWNSFTFLSTIPHNFTTISYNCTAFPYNFHRICLQFCGYNNFHNTTTISHNKFICSIILLFFHLVLLYSICSQYATTILHNSTTVSRNFIAVTLVQCLSLHFTTFPDSFVQCQHVLIIYYVILSQFLIIPNKSMLS